MDNWPVVPDHKHGDNKRLRFTMAQARAVN